MDTNQKTQLTSEEIKVIAGLKDRGYAVILWTPDELDGTDPNHIEDASIAYGFDLIDMNRSEENGNA